MEGGVVDGEAIIFEHVEESGLPGIVEPQEENFGTLVVETCIDTHTSQTPP